MTNLPQPSACTETKGFASIAYFETVMLDHSRMLHITNKVRKAFSYLGTLLKHSSVFEIPRLIDNEMLDMVERGVL